MSTEAALIVGGGIAGMAAAIRLRQQGLSVELVDIDPEWRVYGAGITVTGATLRAFKQLGVFEEIEKVGAFQAGQRMFKFDGTPLSRMEVPPIEEGLPASGGIMRPALHGILSKRVLASGTKVRLGVSIKSIEQDASGVDVIFTDGSSGRYAFVVGADGIYSGVRALLFPNAVQPEYTGQCSWRIVADRPAGMTEGAYYLGHRNLVGMTACSADQMYVFILNPDPDKTWIEPADQPAKVRELLADFGGDIAKVRENVTSESSIVYRPLESALQPAPWHQGRVVLIGDASHSTTPHLASGAGMAVEDALVLVDELKQHGGNVERAFEAFTTRRFARCQMVVETSVAIGKHQLAQGPAEETGVMTGKAMHALAANI